MACCGGVKKYTDIKVTSDFVPTDNNDPVEMLLSIRVEKTPNNAPVLQIQTEDTNGGGVPIEDTIHT